MKCDICQKEIIGYSNNAWPISNGRCCDLCNSNYVVPSRLFLAGLIKDGVMILNAEDNSITIEKVKGEISLKRCQEIVNGYIELYPIENQHFYFIVNEEGIIKKLKPNKLAYQLFGIKVLGNMIVCPKNLFN